MYDIFLDFSKIIAPFTPFIAEEIYQNLKTKEMQESIHLCDYPVVNESYINPDLEDGMERIRSLVEVGRALRSKIGIKVRYPLQKATIICSKEVENHITNIIDLLIEEINVKTIDFSRTADMFMEKQVKPNYAVLGPKLKEKAGLVSKQLEQIDKKTLYQDLLKDKSIDVKINDESITLTLDDFEIVEQEKEHIARTEINDMILILDTHLTEELEAEGFARELVRRIQSMRKELNLDVEKAITTEIQIDKGKEIMVSNWKQYIMQETRSSDLIFRRQPKGSLVKEWDIDEDQVTIAIRASP